MGQKHLEEAGGGYGIIRRIIVSILFIVIIFLWASNVIQNTLSITPAAYFGNNLSSDVLSQYSRLKKYLDQPPNEWRGYDSMQKIFPEGLLFSFSFFNYAVANMALTDSTFSKEEAAKTLDQTIQRVLSERVQDAILSPWSDYKQTGPLTESVIYRGHLNLMLGNYRLVSGDNRYDELHHKLTVSLYDDFKKSPYAHIQSYPGYAWPADNTVALASLQLYDEIFKTNYGSIAKEWENWMKAQVADKETQLMDSQISTLDGSSLAGPRGCALSWSLVFLKDSLPDFSKEQYALYKQYFFQEGHGLTAIREWKKGYKGFQDADTGPIFFGVGSAASGIGLATTKAFGDQGNFVGLLRLGEALGFSVEQNGERTYLGGLCLLCDTLALWGKTQRPIADAAPVKVAKPSLIISVIVLIGGILAGINLIVLRRRIKALRAFREHKDKAFSKQIDRQGKMSTLFGLLLTAGFLAYFLWAKNIYIFLIGLLFIIGLLESVDRFFYKRFDARRLQSPSLGDR